MPQQKRRKLLVNKRLQIGLFMKWLILPLILSFFIFYYFKTNIFILILGLAAITMLSWRVLIISHRIAGPIYRLEKDLQDIAKGNFSMRIKFRKKDELKSIAEGINRILDEIEKRIGH
jgi:signal transduction histidine kinase